MKISRRCNTAFLRYIYRDSSVTKCLASESLTNPVVSLTSSYKLQQISSSGGSFDSNVMGISYCHIFFSLRTPSPLFVSLSLTISLWNISFIPFSCACRSGSYGALMFWGVHLKELYILSVFSFARLLVLCRRFVNFFARGLLNAN